MFILQHWKTFYVLWLSAKAYKIVKISGCIYDKRIIFFGGENDFFGIYLRI